jgi:dihydrofolate reductase
VTVVSVVAAVARGGVIGREGGIPWHLPEDVAHFKSLTDGHSVVMGRRTWDSLPERFRPLPRRRNVVVTRSTDWSTEGAERAASIDEALDLLRDETRVFVIGGAEIYAAALPHAQELVLTEIDLEIDGDTFFPEWDRTTFVPAWREAHVSDDGTSYAFATYRRSDPSRQLAALADVDRILAAASQEYWLFGGWAVDFHAGRITRPHGDVDVAVWLADLPRIGTLPTPRRTEAPGTSAVESGSSSRTWCGARTEVSSLPCATSRRRGPMARSAPRRASSKESVRGS